MTSRSQNATGYASRAYAEALSEFGEPIHLPRSDGWLLKRQIPGTDDFDAMGPYPLFCCTDWNGLATDLADLPEEVLSVAFVADPFGAYTARMLEQIFHVASVYKAHYIVDLSHPAEELGSRHHRREARKALGKIRVEACRDPAGFFEDWNPLYRALVVRHGIRGIQAFSETAFRQHLAMPEVRVLQAYYEDRLVGAQLYYIQDGVAHCHLGAASAEGYDTGAFYAMDCFSFDYFSGRARLLDLGGGAGVSVSASDGLSRYKQGWSTQTQPVFFCGRITNPKRYERLAAPHGQIDYFPAYREGEFS